MDYNLFGKTAIVTGATRGIGKGIAFKFVAKNNVIITTNISL